jgi:hypothetical protein
MMGYSVDLSFIEESKMDGGELIRWKGQWCNRTERQRFRLASLSSPELRSELAGAFLLGFFSSKWCGDKGDPHPRFNAVGNGFMMVGGSGFPFLKFYNGVSILWWVSGFGDTSYGGGEAWWSSAGQQVGAGGIESIWRWWCICEEGGGGFQCSEGGCWAAVL